MILSLFEATAVASFCETEDVEGFSIDTLYGAARTLVHQGSMNGMYDAVVEEILRRASFVPTPPPNKLEEPNMDHTIPEITAHAAFIKRHGGVLVATFFLAMFAGVLWGFIGVMTMFVSCQGLHP